MSNVAQIEQALPAMSYQEVAQKLRDWKEERRDTYVAHVLRAFRLRPGSVVDLQRDINMQQGHFFRLMQRYGVPQSAYPF